EGLGDLVLFGDPSGHIRRLADVVLEPAIRVGHERAVVVIRMIDAAGRGICERAVRGGNGDDDSQRYDDENKPYMRRHQRGSLSGSDVYRHSMSPKRKRGRAVSPPAL